jgi:hypothetical protein
MEDNVVEKKVEAKKPSTIENLGKASLQIGEKLGKAATEWFTGKPLSEEEKVRRSRLRQLKQVQEEAQFRIDMEAAQRGEYVPPEKPKQAKKKDDALDVFKNLGKHNPLEDFNNKSSLGSHDFGVEAYGGRGKEIRKKDLQIVGYDKNPLK